jgi:MFS transporter, DHA2 family, methylenomycin A resistance protein
MGSGFSLAFPALTVVVMAAAPKDLAGIASGALNSSRQGSEALGVAVLGAILKGSPAFLEGMHHVLLVAGIALVIGCFFVLTFVSRT